jgi:peptidyl-dipeptidase A
MRVFTFFFLFALAIASCNNQSQKPKDNTAVRERTDRFLTEYNNKFQELQTIAQEAQWRSNTYILKGDSLTSKATDDANKVLAEYTGSSAVIDSVQALMKFKNDLTEIQVKQLQTILYSAANNPQSLKDIVDQRIKAETEQITHLFGFDFRINGKKVSTNDIDKILNESKNLKERENAWNASKEVGKTLKDGLVNLQSLRNQSVQPLGYSDYFTYQVSDYGMTTDEMMKLNSDMIKQVWPLYRELHTWARYELAKRYGEKNVPDYLPAHWLSNRWGQDWSAMVDVEGLNLDSVLKTKPKEWFAEQAERFYMSIGFPSLPKSFWEKSSLYPLPKDAIYSKNNHASAWHIDLKEDVRSLMSIEPNSEWYETTHHEFGHIYYYLTYNNKDVPYVLRAGANRAYHEAFGSMMGLAAMQKPFIAGIGLLPGNTPTNDTLKLLKDALNYIVFIPWSAGVMTQFEHDLYAKNLSKDEYNKRWWELVKNYQGIVPPSERGEQYCDAASKTHINDDAAQYYDYALSYLLLFQVHDAISRNILHQDPHTTNYYGNKEVGEFLKKMMYPGASGDWRKILKESTGSDLSAKAMVDYFMPLMDYLKKANEGRKYTLPETIN